MKKLIGCLLLALTCQAQANDSKLMEKMTWLEIQAAVKDTKVVIIPLGTASKEHGPHLPMNTDAIMADYLRDRVLAQMDHVLVAPTMTYGYYSTFVDYPGTISLSYQTSLGLILDPCRVLAKQGFKRFYILNTGIRTLDVLKVAKTILNAEGIQMDYLDSSDIKKEPAVHAVLQEVRGTHANEFETSMMLYMAPEVVDMTKAKKDDFERPSLSKAIGLTPNPKDKTKSYSATGIWGDATLATKEKGKVITEATVAYVIKDIKKLETS